MAGCYFCIRQYEDDDIIEWCDGGTTPICPHCHIDSVMLGDVDKNELVRLCEQWFTGSK